MLPRAPQTPSHRGCGGGPCCRGDRRGPAHGPPHESETYRDGEQAGVGQTVAPRYVGQKGWVRWADRWTAAGEEGKGVGKQEHILSDTSQDGVAVLHR